MPYSTALFLRHFIRNLMRQPMRVFTRMLTGLVLTLAWSNSTWAQIDQRPIATTATAKTPSGLEPQSGFWQMSRATQDMQTDDRQNPAMLWVHSGQALWDAVPERTNAKSCAACHGPLQTMRGVAARYPAWNPVLAAPANLGQAINACRQTHQVAAKLPPEHAHLLALEALLALQSRGMPLERIPDPRLQAATRAGEVLFHQRLGQLNLSCAQCHDQLASPLGNQGPPRLGAALIPQGHPTGYPLYRLEWQTLGSLQRRIRNCMSGVRAQAYAHGASELLALELYLAQRALGLVVDAPAVRP